MYFELIMHEVSKIDALKKSMAALNEEKRFTTKFNGSRYLRYKTNLLNLSIKKTFYFQPCIQFSLFFSARHSIDSERLNSTDSIKQ